MTVASHFYFERYQMKIPRLEAIGRRMRDHHRHHPWCLSKGGLYIPHDYSDMTPSGRSDWGDVGFVLNGRRFIVWWQHPRLIYRRAIRTMAFEELGDQPDPNWLFDGATTLYKQVGRSGKRKKPIGHRSRESSEAQQAYYVLLCEAIGRISGCGIDLDIRPSWTWKRFSWGMGLEVVAPIEIRNEPELAQLADLAKRLVCQKATLATEFPGAVYNRQSWLHEQTLEMTWKDTGAAVPSDE